MVLYKNKEIAFADKTEDELFNIAVRMNICKSIAKPTELISLSTRLETERQRRLRLNESEAAVKTLDELGVEYNKLAAKYNALLEKNSSLVSEYNILTTDYNKLLFLARSMSVSVPATKTAYQPIIIQQAQPTRCVKNTMGSLTSVNCY